MAHNGDPTLSLQITDVKPTPFITADGLHQVTVFLKSTRAFANVWGKITLAGFAPNTVNLGKISRGKSEHSLLLPDTNSVLRPGETTALKIELYATENCDGAPLTVYENPNWERTRHWQFYLSQMMHTDLGYTDYQETLRPLFTSYLNTAKGYIKASESRENETEKYKFAVESSWAVTAAYMKEQNAEELEELADLIKQGKVMVGAGKYNCTMECFGTEETARAAYHSKRIVPDRLHAPSSDTLRMFDNPAVSKSYVDIANSAGIKYAIHSMNPDRSPYHKEKLYDIFYMTGFNPENKLLIFNGKSYGENYGFCGNYENPKKGDAKMAAKTLLGLIEKLEAKTGRTAYPYDKFPLPLIPFGDNKPPLDTQIKIANEVNGNWQAKGYAYPKIIAAFPEQFFAELEQEYSALIPVETGTEENWWNDGWGTTAHESGTNKRNSNLLPVAETAASFASLNFGETYPYDDLFEAWERCSVYNEHTWGFNTYKDCDEYHQQFEWKRSNALGANALVEKTMDSALHTLAKHTKTAGQSIFVYNALNKQRTDIVSVELGEDFPKTFCIYNGGESVAYEKNGNTVTFVAKDIPAMGYKVFSVVSAPEKPVFKGKTTCDGLCAESPFYRLTLNRDGTVQSILDKENGNREIVDGYAEVKWNQYQYYDDFGIPFSNMGAKFTDKKWKLYRPKEENTTIQMVPTAYGMKIVVLTGTFRAGSILQTITLYDDIARIDIDNKVLKSPLPKLQHKEEAFYTFPFKADKGYEIRCDLPVGNTAEGEQVFGTSTDWYTVNKWVNVYDKKDNYRMTLALKTASLVQFGERRTGNWSFDYKSEQPCIYSYVFNNMWQTNFQGDQPGTAEFSYSVSTEKGNSIEHINQFALCIAEPLQAVAVQNTGESDKYATETATFMTLSHENVMVTTLKAAEPNGDGLIVRFHEFGGKSADNVTATFAKEIVSYTETDIVENDMGTETKDAVLRFSLKPYEMKTFRIKTAQTLPSVTGVKAVFSTTALPRAKHYQKARVTELLDKKDTFQGVAVSWEALAGALYYEVFRTKQGGEPLFLGATKNTAWFDTQVTSEICEKYQYAVRAVGCGQKGEFSAAVSPVCGETQEGCIFEAPILHGVPREKNRIDLYWTPVQSIFPVSHYEIYRNGKLIGKTTDSYITSYRDYGARFGEEYEYRVCAVDTSGTRSESNKLTLNLKDEFLEKQDSPLATTKKRRWQK
ncbi:MAG: glycosyl hydrolase-related protein [Candidatus Fimenecus sp.]